MYRQIINLNFFHRVLILPKNPSMRKDLATKSDKIKEKIHMLISLDQQKRLEIQNQNNNLFAKQILQITARPRIQQIIKQKNQQQIREKQKEIIYTKSDIVNEIKRLKPYLKHDKDQLTTVELQNYKNKHISDQEKKNLSNVIIYLNKKLCEKLREEASLQEELELAREKKEKEGWIYEVFYRYSTEPKAQLSNTPFFNGYVILTSIFQLYSTLTFQELLIKFNVSQLKRVKYTQQNQYQVIQIRYDGGSVHIAFLNENQMKLFDRMFFLLKNMARTSTTRLFQNQLIKTLYSEY